MMEELGQCLIKDSYCWNPGCPYNKVWRLWIIRFSGKEEELPFCYWGGSALPLSIPAELAARGAMPPLSLSPQHSEGEDFIPPMLSPQDHLPLLETWKLK